MTTVACVIPAFDAASTIESVAHGLRAALPDAMLIHLLPRAVDRVLLDVEQMLDEHHQLNFAALVDAIARAILRRVQELELTFPISKDVRLESREVAHFSDREEFLYRLRAHESPSARSSRRISSLMAVRGGWCSKSIR